MTIIYLAVCLAIAWYFVPFILLAIHAVVCGLCLLLGKLFSDL
jgi:hypothetical protein